MPQFGADTVIPPGVKLILMDCFETLVALEGGKYQPRLGVVELLRHYVRRPKPVTIAVISDAPEAQVKAALNQAGIARLIARIYHAGNAAEPLPEGKTRKRLDLPVRDYQVTLADTVFIGDSPLDAEAAAHHGMPFIRVPRSEDIDFTFTTLVAGPSRYASQDFNGKMIGHYLSKNATAPPPPGDAQRP
jgi:FMN phosphatase YigB (HAD superfamily)